MPGQVIHMPVPQADATSETQPPAAGAAVPQEAPAARLGAMLGSAVHNLQTAVHRLTSGSPPGAVAANDLQYLLTRYVELQETAGQLEKRLQKLPPEEGAAMGLGREIEKLQAQVESWIGSVEGELQGADVRPVGPLGQPPEAAPAPTGGKLHPYVKVGLFGVAAAGAGYLAWRLTRARTTAAR